MSYVSAGEYLAVYGVVSGDSQGVVSISVALSTDLAGNQQTETTTSDASHVVIDTVLQLSTV